MAFYPKLERLFLSNDLFIDLAQMFALRRQTVCRYGSLPFHTFNVHYRFHDTGVWSAFRHGSVN
ncbi:hypothetical protein PDM99_25470 [Bacillus cereus group sp. Bc200]|uniref:hypothetical protein n=1 Tax=Bacillus cereus group TaxID=86661 RepID=UPI0022E53358|nr:hypothetical protein [Bacillus cereus group sp. Bc200]MDA2263571.1 hypothetical protein [Bacillus cereus group sp. Bc200]